MNLDFVRFKAADGVELQGWLNNESGDTAVVHIHGMSGNGYENYFLDGLRKMYADHGIALFTIDSRGRGIISDFRQGEGWKHAGSCFEIFEESVHDIKGAVEYLKTLGKSKFILQGHSLGCTKTVNFVLNQSNTGIKKIILLAPTDMAGWANTDPKHEAYLTKAKQLLAEGKNEELVDAQCWLDKTPISAQTYPTICKAGSSADIYGNREGGALLGKVELPMLIPYGDEDIGITKIDGSMDKWLERVKKIKNANTEVAVIKGAAHSFRGYEKELANIIEGFIQ
jgi:alpha-beta hydrolase superfamily lysophospholipase